MTTKYGKAINQVGERSTFETTELSANMEDYIEAIAVLARENRVVRVKDIARYLDIKMPSVTAALGKLKEKGLVNYEKYGYAELTEEGTKAATTVSRKHAFLKDFFHDVLRMGKDLSDEEASGWSTTSPPRRAGRYSAWWSSTAWKRTRRRSGPASSMTCSTKAPERAEGGRDGLPRADLRRDDDKKTPHGNGVPEGRTGHGGQVRAAQRSPRDHRQGVPPFPPGGGGAAHHCARPPVPGRAAQARAPPRQGQGP